MKSNTDRRVRREDVERYRRALQELGGEASLEEIAEHADERELGTDLGYIAACLIVPAPTKRDPDIALPFAIPSAWGRDRQGRRTWRVERHWTAEDLKEGQRFLQPGTDADDDNGPGRMNVTRSVRLRSIHGGGNGRVRRHAQVDAGSCGCGRKGSNTRRRR